MADPTDDTPDSLGDQFSNPTNYPWLTRLMNRFGLLKHPVALEDDPEDEAARYAKKFREWWENQFRLSVNRRARYQIFRDMDQFDMVQSVFDTYAEEMTQIDYDKQRSIWIESKHPRMVESGDGCLHNIMAEDRLYGIARRACLMGDDFWRTIYQAGKGVLGWRYEIPEDIERMEDKFDRLTGFKQKGKTFRGQHKHEQSFPWDFVHFRVIGREADTKYGSSMAAPLYRPMRRLVLMEDSDLLYNLKVAGSRQMVLVDIGTQDEVEANNTLSAFRKRMKRHSFIDPACLALNQPIRTLRGVDQTLSEIIRDFKKGKETWVYSFDESLQKIVPGKVSWAGVTRRKAEVLEVELDDGTIVTCTPDHKFAVMDGKPITHGRRTDKHATKVVWQEAKDLKVGAQLVPLRRGSHLKGGRRRYETLLDPFGGWGFTHYRVCDEVASLREALRRTPQAQRDHYPDHNTFNNDPSNLQIRTAAEHTSRHHPKCRVNRLCGFCKLPFKVHPNDNTKFCSAPCRKKGQRKTDPSKWLAFQYAKKTAEGTREQICPNPNCRRKFRATLSALKANPNKCCCKKCWQELCIEQAKRDCVYCGVEFIPKPAKRHKQKFCTHRCYLDHKRKVSRGEVPVPNHRVMSVRILTKRIDTGDITVDKHHNFFVADADNGGVLVHNSNRYKSEYNPVSPIEDIFLAIRGPDDQTRIEQLPGNPNQLSPERLQYYVRMFAGAARVPISYLGWEGEIGSKSGLAQMDVRFARTLKRGRRMLIRGFRNVLDFHFMLADENPEENTFDIEKFPYLVQMPPISYLDEWERLELVQLRYSLVQAMAGLGQALAINPHAWSQYVLIHFAKLPENVVSLLTRKMDAANVADQQAQLNPQGANGDGKPGGPTTENLRRKRHMLTEVEKRFGVNGGGKWSDGYYQDLNEDEQKQVAVAIHNSPLLRKSISDVAIYHEGDKQYATDVLASMQQSDPSILAPLTAHGVPLWLCDDVENDKEMELLQEHLASSIEAGREAGTEENNGA